MKDSIIKRFISFVVLFCTIVFPAYPSPFAAEKGAIGTVTSKDEGGNVQHAGTTKHVGRSEPFFLESTFTTGKQGGLSFIMNDRTRLELGSNSSIYITGEHGKYIIGLKKGEIAFNVPQDSTLTIRTTDTEIEVPFEKVTYRYAEPRKEKESFIGLASYDGKTTQVYSSSGDIKIKTGETDSEVMKVSSGKGAIITTEIKDDRKVMSVQLVEETSPVSKGKPLSLSRKKLLYAVGAVAFVGVLAVGLSGGGGGGGGGGSPPASPSQ